MDTFSSAKLTIVTWMCESSSFNVSLMVTTTAATTAIVSWQNLSDKRIAYKKNEIIVIENALDGLDHSKFKWKKEAHAHLIPTFSIDLSLNVYLCVYIYVYACVWPHIIIPNCCSKAHGKPQKFWEIFLRWVDCFSSKHPWKMCDFFSK